MVGPSAFDAYYYKHCCGKPYFRNDEWLAFFGGIAQRIVDDIAPTRVLDAGCALGLLVEGLRSRGVDAYGIDVSTFAIEHAHESVAPFCRVGSVSGDLGGDYDLIVSIEVLEHMPKPEAERAIANFCAHASAVLFSSSPLDHREPTHVNVNPPEYWAEQFARHDFFRDVDYDATYITPWAARFRKRADPVHRLVRDYERRYWALLHQSVDARAYATDTEQALANVEAERDALKAERDRLAGEKAPLDAEIARLMHDGDRFRREAALSAAENVSLATGLAQARDTIHHMERSRFWRLRLIWRQISELFS